MIDRIHPQTRRAVRDWIAAGSPVADRRPTPEEVAALREAIAAAPIRDRRWLLRLFACGWPLDRILRMAGTKARDAAAGPNPQGSWRDRPPLL